MEYDSFADLLFAISVPDMSMLIEDEFLINNSVLTHLVDALIVLVDSSLVEHFLFAICDNFLTPMFSELEPNMRKLLDLPTAYGDAQLFQEDLVALVSILKDVIALDVLGFVVHDRTLQFNTEVDYVANIFAKVFGLNYLANPENITNISNLVAEMLDVNVSELDVQYIAENLAADGQLFGAAVSTLFKH